MTFVLGVTGADVVRRLNAKFDLCYAILMKYVLHNQSGVLMVTPIVVTLIGVSNCTP